MLKGFAILVLGLLTGNELAVALIHPVLSDLPDSTHIASVQVIGRRYGRLMPIWMALCLLLCAIATISLPLWSLSQQFAAIATLLMFVSIVFSLVGPVPINDRIIRWQPQHLPSNWKHERDRWDQFHLIRVGMLAIAFICLVAANSLI